MSETAGSGLNAAKVLVVEDDEMVRDYAQAVLTALGYQPLAVGDGSAALRVLEEQRDIRLLLTDIGLPGGMSGAALAEEARRRKPGLPVLFASGSIDSGGKAHLVPEGEAVLAKPYRKADLAEKLRLLLGAV
ncbi:MAG TPA: response regulator [Alphaproteobacteria bacterium]|jgi:CheY-like chemotaxis protein